MWKAQKIRRNTRITRQTTKTTMIIKMRNEREGHIGKREERGSDMRELRERITIAIGERERERERGHISLTCFATNSIAKGLPEGGHCIMLCPVQLSYLFI